MLPGGVRVDIWECAISDGQPPGEPTKEGREEPGSFAGYHLGISLEVIDHASLLEPVKGGAIVVAWIKDAQRGTGFRGWIKANAHIVLDKVSRRRVQHGLGS